MHGNPSTKNRALRSAFLETKYVVILVRKSAFLFTTYVAILVRNKEADGPRTAALDRVHQKAEISLEFERRREKRAPPPVGRRERDGFGYRGHTRRQGARATLRLARRGVVEFVGGLPARIVFLELSAPTAAID